MEKRMITSSLKKRLWVIAHRGGKPENTLAAFWSAYQDGVDMVEADIRYTKDGYPIIFHDQFLSFESSEKEISNLTFSQIKQQNKPFNLDPQYKNESIPSLEDLLRLAKNRFKILLDIKETTPNFFKVIELIASYKMEFDVVLGIRSLKDLKYVKREYPVIRTLSFGYPMDTAYEILNNGADILRLWEPWVTGERVRAVREQGKQVWLMIGDFDGGKQAITKSKLINYLEMGINGVILDNPQLALNIAR
jgi:glycerophosphoryl diester phosphodiesterase